jgi:hypothetical protein
MSASSMDAATITEHEAQAAEPGNDTGPAPVAFSHGLWLLPQGRSNWSAASRNGG